MRNPNDLASAVQELLDRITKLEHQAELIKTVLIVREPDTVHAANAYDGLRKQVIAASGERRSHLAQLVAMAVAVSRAGSVDDLRPQLREWFAQAGVAELWTLPPGARPQDVFEDLEGRSLEGAAEIDVLEPAYADSATGVLLRLGRARAAVPTGAIADDGGVN